MRNPSAAISDLSYSFSGANTSTSFRVAYFNTSLKEATKSVELSGKVIASSLLNPTTTVLNAKFSQNAAAIERNTALRAGTQTALAVSRVTARSLSAESLIRGGVV
jgi:hypothetical protein